MDNWIISWKYQNLKRTATVKIPEKWICFEWRDWWPARLYQEVLTTPPALSLNIIFKELWAIRERKANVVFIECYHCVQHRNTRAGRQGSTPCLQRLARLCPNRFLWKPFRKTIFNVSKDFLSFFCFLLLPSCSSLNWPFFNGVLHPPVEPTPKI